jgi:DNA repair protein RadC
MDSKDILNLTEALGLTWNGRAQLGFCSPERHDTIRESLAEISFVDLACATAEELVDMGFWMREAERIASIFRIARRYVAATPEDSPLRATNPLSIAAYLREDFRNRKQEITLVLTLNTLRHIQNKHIVSIGTLNGSLVHPREVFRPAIRDAASEIILVHNHPSGDPRPSDEDIALTTRMTAAGELVGIRLLDHIIIAEGSEGQKVTSFREEELI